MHCFLHMYKDLFKPLYEEGKVSKRLVELAEKIDSDDNLYMTMHLAQPYIYLGLSQELDAARISSEFIHTLFGALPTHPYFPIKFMAAYAQKLVQISCEESKLSYILKNRPNWENDKKIIFEFCDEIINLNIPFENELKDNITKKVWADDAYFEHLAAAASIGSGTGLLVLMVLGKDKFVNELRKTHGEDLIKRSTQVYIDEISTQLFGYCLKHFLTEQKRIDTKDIVSSIDDICANKIIPIIEQNRTPLALAQKTILNHTKMGYVTTLINPASAVALQHN